MSLVTDCSNLAALLVGVMKRGGFEVERVSEVGAEYTAEGEGEEEGKREEEGEGEREWVGEVGVDPLGVALEGGRGGSGLGGRTKMGWEVAAAKAEDKQNKQI